MRIISILLLSWITLPFYLSGQCSGNITIKSQSEVDKYPCSEFKSGVLTISGSDIKDLSPLEILNFVDGALIVENNPALSSLEGLHNIQEITGSFNIVNNDVLETFGNKEFVLQQIGSRFQFIDNPNLTYKGNLTFLKTIVSGFLMRNSGNIDGFDQLSFCPSIEIDQHTGGEINGFNSLQEMNYLNIVDCGNLEQITGFKNLEEVTGGSGTFQIKDNDQLEFIDGFSSLNEVGQLTITGNSRLKDCCMLIPSIVAVPASANISGNGIGCSSVGQVNAAPTLANCPSDATVNTSNGSCTASFSLTQPTPSDNCDLSFTDASLKLSDGSSALSGSINGGSTGSYNLQIGQNTFEFTAIDEAQNETICSAIITVEDNEDPILSNCPSNQTISTESNIQCSGSLSYSAPDADDCALNTYREKMTLPNGTVISDITISSGENFTKTFSLGTSTLEYTAIDANGNIATCSTSITVEDDKAPVLSGIPSDVTISCGDAFPVIPSPTATDLCSGNLNSAITVSSSISNGSCMPGEIAEIQEYSWNVMDDAGNEANGSWKVTVVSDFEFDLGEDLSLCGSNSVEIEAGNIGATYQWSTGESTSGISVSSSGTYSLTVTTENGCCFADDVVVSIGTNPNAEASGGMLSCTAGSLNLQGSSSTSGVNYSWAGPGGFTSNAQNPSVTSAGTYILTVTTNNGCSSTAEATVSADTNLPDVGATGGELSCDVSQITISSNSSTSGVNFSWTGPGGFTSNAQNPSVSTPGIYTVTATASNGCAATADAEVTSDADGPDLSISADELNCSILEIMLDVDASADAQSFSWTGPSGFTSDDRLPIVSETGTYTLMATGQNGCTTTQSVTVSGDYAEPDVEATGGMISCTDNETTISGSTTTANPIYSWTGPNDFTSDQKEPAISQPGTYTLVVIAENGCSSSAEAIVVGDSDVPEVNASGGTIDCVNETVMIQGAVSQSGATSSWTGPNGFATSNLTAVVDIPGVYTFTVVTEGGCQTFVSVNVVLDNSEPSFSIGEGFIDCDDRERNFLLATDADDPTFEWTGPDGYTSTEMQPRYSKAGTYNVTINGGNGCVSSGSISVEHDIGYTYDISTNDGDTEITIQGGTPPFSFLWNDNVEGNTISGLQIGDNFIRVTDGLACEDLIFFEITSSSHDLLQEEGVKIYPNPVQNVIYLELPENLVNSDLEILEQSGRVIHKGKTTTQVDVNHYPAGIYLMRILNGEKAYHFKFVKQ